MIVEQIVVNDENGNLKFSIDIPQPTSYEETEELARKYSADPYWYRVIIRAVHARMKEEVKVCQRGYPKGHTITTKANS